METPALTPTQTQPPVSLLNKEPDAPAEPSPQQAADYTEFKIPEGQQLNKELVASVTPVFKELGLTQEQGQKLVDFYSKNQGDMVNKLYSDMQETRTKWRSESEAYLGAGATQAKVDIGRALNVVFDGDSKKLENFRSFMDMTGAGDNPAFVEAFHKLSKRVVEGRSVTGGGPSEQGQQAPGAATRPTPAAALYPNLANPPQSG